MHNRSRSAPIRDVRWRTVRHKCAGQHEFNRPPECQTLPHRLQASRPVRASTMATLLATSVVTETTYPKRSGRHLPPRVTSPPGRLSCEYLDAIRGDGGVSPSTVLVWPGLRSGSWRETRGPNPLRPRWGVHVNASGEPLWRRWEGGSPWPVAGPRRATAVSYTHLTLPTICSV